jgi:hypothetical protein
MNHIPPERAVRKDGPGWAMSQQGRGLSKKVVGRGRPIYN